MNGDDESGFVDRPEPTRSRNVNLDAVELKNVRVTRNSKNKKNAVEICDNREEVKKNVRVTRNSKNKKNMVEVCDSSNGDLEGVKEKVEEVNKECEGDKEFEE